MTGMVAFFTIFFSLFGRLGAAVGFEDILNRY
jgi:hypothetical protein